MPFLRVHTRPIGVSGVGSIINLAGRDDVGLDGAIAAITYAGITREVANLHGTPATRVADRDHFPLLVELVVPIVTSDRNGGSSRSRAANNLRRSCERGVKFSATEKVSVDVERLPRIAP